MGLFPNKPNRFPDGKVRYGTLMKCNLLAIVIISRKIYVNLSNLLIHCGIFEYNVIRDIDM